MNEDYAKWWCFKCQECGSPIQGSKQWNGYHCFSFSCCKKAGEVYAMHQFKVELHADGKITAQYLKDNSYLDVKTQDWFKT